MSKKRKGHIFWAYLFVFAAIYFSMDTLLFGTNGKEIFSTILYVSVPVLAVIAFIYAWWINSWIASKAFLAAVGVCIMVLCTHFTTESVLNMKYFFLCAVILLAFLISAVIPVDVFKRVFINVVSVLALVSVAGFFLRYLFPGIINYLPTITNINGYRYGHLLLTVIPHDVIYVPFRNYGIFREPGVYQFFLNMALFFLLDNVELRKTWRFYAIMLAMVFTFSTAGYLLCMAVFLLYFFLGKLEIRPSTVIPMVIAGLFLAFLFAYGLIKPDGSVFSKLFSSNSSTNSRFGSILVDFYLAMMKPIFGNGFEFVENNFKLISRSIFGLKRMHNTNTVMKMLAVFGFAFPSLFLSGIALFCRKHMDRRSFPLFVVIFVAMLSASDLIFNAIIYVFMFYGYQSCLKPVYYHENFTN